MWSPQQGMQESLSQRDSLHSPTFLLDVPVCSIESFGTDGSTFGERRQWHEHHPDLRSWVPSVVDDATWEQLQAFTGWFDIVQHNSSQVIRQTGHERPSMLWLWFNTEHLAKERVFKVLIEGAQLFHKKVAWCSVYHPELYMKTTEKVDQALSITLRELSEPIAFAKITRAISAEAQSAGTESGPSEVPSDGDLLGELSSEEEQDGSPRP